MRIEQFDPLGDPARLGACYEIFEAIRQHDDPADPQQSPAGFRSWWGYGFDGGEPRQAWLGRDAGGPAGAYLLELPDRENTALANIALLVPPPRRRQGTGTALLAHAMARARAAGRTALFGSAVPGSSGEAFARSAGGAGGLVDIRRVLRMSDLTGGQLDALLAEAATQAAGYSLLSWTGAAPDEQVAQVAQLYDAMADAPRGAGVDAARADSARVRAMETPNLTAGFRIYTVAARHDASGDLAALTQITIDPEIPAAALQALTAVSQPHRGHRLGLLVKAASHQWLARAEPGVRAVSTWNAADNEHMIAINERLGYQVNGRAQSWQLAVPAQS